MSTHVAPVNTITKVSTFRLFARKHAAYAACWAAVSVVATSLPHILESANWIILGSALRDRLRREFHAFRPNIFG
jgi:hypothetical protein